MSAEVLNDLYKTVEDRKAHPIEGSYTDYLFEKGLDKILKKVGEECSETIIAAKNMDNNELKNEISDLVYHLVVLCVQQKLPLEDIFDVLEQRSHKIGNLKKMHVVDKDS